MFLKDICIMHQKVFARGVGSLCTQLDEAEDTNFDVYSKDLLL